MTERVIKSDVIGEQLCELIGINPKTVRNITIELPAGQPMLVTIERWGTERFMSYGGWPEIMANARIEEVEA